MVRKMISLSLACILALALIPLPAAAQDMPPARITSIRLEKSPAFGNAEDMAT